MKFCSSYYDSYYCTIYGIKTKCLCYVFLPRFLGEYCKSLKMLQIRECHYVTEKTLQLLRENKVKMDVHPPPSAYNARMDQFSLRLRHRLNLQI